MDRFATAITCIDGRVQQPVTDWMRLQFNVRYVDLITEPGPDKALAEGPQPIRDEVVRKVRFSLRYHYSEVVAIAGHDSCAANDASREEHIEQIMAAATFLVHNNLQARIVGLWVNEWGSVDLVCDTKEIERATSFL